MAHWFGLVSMIIVVWAVWLLIDAGWTKDSAVGHAGARLTILSGTFMAEIGAGRYADAYAAGRSAPLIDLLEAMQVVGWPALGVGFALLALGVTQSAPRVVSMLAAIGGVAAGLGGIVVMGLHVLPAAPLFAGTNLLVPWIVWACAPPAASGARSKARLRRWHEARPRSVPDAWALLNRQSSKRPEGTGTGAVGSELIDDLVDVGDADVEECAGPVRDPTTSLASPSFRPRVSRVRDGMPMLDDGRVIDIANVIWCAAFVPNFGWIDLPVLDEDGHPVYESGVVESDPDLYFMGQFFLDSLSSVLIGGVVGPPRTSRPTSHRGPQGRGPIERMQTQSRRQTEIVDNQSKSAAGPESLQRVSDRSREAENGRHGSNWQWAARRRK